MTIGITPEIPIDVIGPSPWGGPGGVPVDSADPKDYEEIPGDKIEPTPMIPPEIKMSENAEKRLVQYLDEELGIAEGERWDWVRKISRLKEKYDAPFPEFPKDWPIANSSQITIPVIKMAVNAVSNRILQTILAAEPIVSVRTSDATEEGLIGDFNWKDFAFQYEKFLDMYGNEKLKYRKVLRDWVIETVKLGTGILEATTELRRRKLVTYDTASGDYVSNIVDDFNGPILFHVPLEDYWQRAGYNDPNEAPWCGKAIRKTWSEIKNMAVSGTLDPEKINGIWKQESEEPPETVTDMEEREKLEPNRRETFTIHELAVRWDVDGDGIDEELMVYFHWPSRTLLRRKHSGFRTRPWIVANYIPTEHWMYGEGLAETVEHLQEEISTMHNQRIDNATIANLRIILVRRLFAGLRPGDRLWTGKIVKVPEDVDKDVGTLQLGEVYPSTERAEAVAMQYVERVAPGAGEQATGSASPVTRTTATAQMAVLEELNRMFDMPIKNFREALTEASQQHTDLFTVVGTGGLAEEFLGPTNGKLVEEGLSQPSELVRRRIKIQVQSTRSTLNKEVEFQSQLAVFQLVIQMWTQIREEAMLTAPQVIPVLQHEIVKTLIPIFKRIMQYSGSSNPEQAVSVLNVLEKLLPAPEDLGGMEGAQAGEDLLAGLQQGGGAGSNGSGPEGAQGDAGVGRVAAAR